MSSSPVQLQRDCAPGRGEHSAKNDTWAFQGQDSEPDSLQISSGCTFSFYDLLASVYGTIILRNSGKGRSFLRWEIHFEVISVKYVVVNTFALRHPYYFIYGTFKFSPNKDMSFFEMLLPPYRMLVVLVFGIGDRGNRCFLLEAVDHTHLPRISRKSGQEIRKEVKFC